MKDLLDEGKAVLGPDTRHVIPQEWALDQPHVQQGPADGWNENIFNL